MPIWINDQPQPFSPPLTLSQLLQQLASERGWQGAHTA